jgi:hypothetical protein
VWTLDKGMKLYDIPFPTYSVSVKKIDNFEKHNFIIQRSGNEFLIMDVENFRNNQVFKLYEE